MQNETRQTSEKFNDFVQKYKSPIKFILIFIGVAFFGFIISYSVISSLRKKDNGKIEELNGRYELLKGEITEDSENEDIETLINDLQSFAEKASAYAGGKAFGIIANIYKQRKLLDEAEAAWVKAAMKAQKTYLEPMAWFNAAGLAEELGHYDQAIEYYTNTLSTYFDFPLAVNSQFSIARIKEAQGDYDGAIEAFRSVITGWSYNTVWTNLAHSRITVLEAQKSAN